MHLLMLHNLDPNTCYTINGVFWTLAIEEQLYLAYFLLLFIRMRWGWGVTLAVCLIARVGWMVFSHVVWLKTGFGVPVPEAAAVHWFTWALGAIGVEAFFGLIKLRGWSRDLRLATVLIVAASAISNYLPLINKDTFLHHAGCRSSTASRRRRRTPVRSTIATPGAGPTSTPPSSGSA